MTASHSSRNLADDMLRQGRITPEEHTRLLRGMVGARPPAPGDASRRMAKSSSDMWVGGVCGGLARSSGLDITAIRLIAITGAVIAGPLMAMLYAAAFWMLPWDAPPPDKDKADRRAGALLFGCNLATLWILYMAVDLWIAPRFLDLYAQAGIRKFSPLSTLALDISRLISAGWWKLPVHMLIGAGWIGIYLAIPQRFLRAGYSILVTAALCAWVGLYLFALFLPYSQLLTDLH